jgi:hypothetical protein
VSLWRFSLSIFLGRDGILAAGDSLRMGGAIAVEMDAPFLHLWLARFLRPTRWLYLARWLWLTRFLGFAHCRGLTRWLGLAHCLRLARFLDWFGGLDGKRPFLSHGHGPTPFRRGLSGNRRRDAWMQLGEVRMLLGESGMPGLAFSGFRPNGIAGFVNRLTGGLLAALAHLPGALVTAATSAATA